MYVTVIVAAPVLVTTPRHISIDEVADPEPLVAPVILVQVLTPPPDTLASDAALFGLEKKTIRSPILAGETLKVEIALPLLFQLFTYVMATLVTWLAHDEKTSWLALLGLVAKHCPAAGVVVGSVSV